MNSPLRGTITAVSPEQGWGFVLTEDGYELYFEARALDGVPMSELRRGNTVEFYLMRYGPGYVFVVERLSLRC
jgi:cold shock CspA family protein